MSEFAQLCHAAGITSPMLLFIGGGNMASALVNGCLSSGIIVLAVKPQSRNDVYKSLSSNGVDLRSCPLLISLLAGVHIVTLKKELLEAVEYSCPIVRLMPNTAAAIGSGASILCADAGVPKEKVDIVKAFASRTGLCVEVNSSTFNAYGVISGSAPAWAFMFIESLADGGVFNGCTRETALKLAAQSVLGAAEMVLSSGEHPAVLKDKVCSPGGTTIAGIRELEKSGELHAVFSGTRRLHLGFRHTVIEAVKAATDRANNMS
ncbi:unnamed protein product [Nippostrongylus brasiliensis]|uniref:pyrroline-5-carboxylate reductase n=1 Tax=Nippostrongylus brasiliensis TaxID=27835 RepID=A0A0N4YPA2_NIPBR|nr:unnamed protein product [Nippostrongylus brasiliensis]